MSLSKTERKKIELLIFQEAARQWPKEEFSSLREIARKAGLEEGTFNTALNNPRSKRTKADTAQFLKRAPAGLFPHINWSKG